MIKKIDFILYLVSFTLIFLTFSLIGFEIEILDKEITIFEYEIMPINSYDYSQNWYKMSSILKIFIVLIVLISISIFLSLIRKIEFKNNKIVKVIDIFLIISFIFSIIMFVTIIGMYINTLNTFKEIYKESHDENTGETIINESIKVNSKLKTYVSFILMSLGIISSGIGLYFSLKEPKINIKSEDKLASFI